jgi:hypothetical protein
MDYGPTTFGESRESGPPPQPGPGLPGEFVSEELRDDCVRFLDELRAQIALRGERERAAWVPQRRAESE